MQFMITVQTMRKNVMRNDLEREKKEGGGGGGSRWEEGGGREREIEVVVGKRNDRPLTLRRWGACCAGEGQTVEWCGARYENHTHLYSGRNII
jgi:hypothetical protein